MWKERRGGQPEAPRPLADHLGACTWPGRGYRDSSGSGGQGGGLAKVCDLQIITRRGDVLLCLWQNVDPLQRICSQGWAGPSWLQTEPHLGFPAPSLLHPSQPASFVLPEAMWGEDGTK